MWMHYTVPHLLSIASVLEQMIIIIIIIIKGINDMPCKEQSLTEMPNLHF